MTKHKQGSYRCVKQTNILFPLRRTTAGKVLNICKITYEEKRAQEVTFHKQLELHSEL